MKTSTPTVASSDAPISRPVQPARAEDWYDPPVFYGFGHVSTIYHYDPTPKERAAIAKKQPIGFVHFPDRE